MAENTANSIAIRRQRSPMAARKNNAIFPDEYMNLDIQLAGAGQPFPMDNDKEQQQRQDSLVAQVEIQRMQLISPPPEEMLSHRRVSGSRANNNFTSAETQQATTATNVSKRKRAPPTPAKLVDPPPQLPQTTPNPKPRKQRHVRVSSMESPTREAFSSPSSRAEVGSNNTTENQLVTTPTKWKEAVVVKSPHANNPDADYIPPLMLLADKEKEVVKNIDRRLLLTNRRSRRSVTPIPPYEPPPDVFTPPREVFLSPAPPKSISRRNRSIAGNSTAKKGKGKGKGLRVNTTPLPPNVQVKQEIPDDIDLLAPMPPPSPTDDPLLLSGPPEPEPERRSTPVVDRRRSVSVQVQTVESLVDVLPPSSPEVLSDTDEAEAVRQFDWHQQQNQEEDHSMDDSLMQMDDPRDADVEPVRLFDVDVGAPCDGGWSDSDDDDVPANTNDEIEGEGEYTGKWWMLKVRTKQDPPSSATRMRQELWGRPISPFPKVKKLDLEGVGEEEEEVRKMSVEPENDESEEEEERQVREMSMDLEEETELPNPKTLSDSDIRYQPAVQMADEEEETSDTDDEPGLVKITSADPRAAARAVAILKQHDYDCYTKLVKKRRVSHSSVDDLAKESRRRETATAGVSKSTRQRHRRSTMGVIGDKVILPGSPVMTLPELLQEVEREVVVENNSRVWSARTAFGRKSTCDPFKTPIPVKFMKQVESHLLTTPNRYPVGKREWAKDDWKLLDACFTDQRIELSEPQDGSLAPVDVVNLEDVITRFIELMGGQSLVDTFGEEWIRDNLLKRTRALMKKQRTGSVAPPTTPAASFSFQSPSNVGTSNPMTIPASSIWPTMEVPDFTPLNRDRHSVTRKSSLSRPVLPSPIVENAPFKDLLPERSKQIKKLPPMLLAPRYSHLLEEAIAVQHDDSSLLHIQEEGGDEDGLQTEIPDTLAESNFNSEPPEETSATEGSQDDSNGDYSTKHHDPGPATKSIGNRVKGFLSSYLPMLSKQPPLKILRHAQPGLPLPPSSVLNKPRGPVATPVRPPQQRPPHPKEIVHLNPAPLPPSNISQPKVVPKRLVELVSVPPPAAKEEPGLKGGLVPRPRRSSGSSVKDLVKGFEHMEDLARKKAVDDRSRKDGRKIDGTRNHLESRPKWRP